MADLVDELFAAHRADIAIALGVAAVAVLAFVVLVAQVVMAVTP